MGLFIHISALLNRVNKSFQSSNDSLQNKGAIYPGTEHLKSGHELLSEGHSSFHSVGQKGMI